MKRLRLIGFLCGIILITAFGCKKEEPLFNTKGYIVGYQPCSVRPPINESRKIGYVIISENLKDTLLTYNLSHASTLDPAIVAFNSDTLYVIPALYFQNYRECPYFPDSLRYKYGVRVSYSNAKESEMVFLACPTDIIFLPYKQIIIKSATKY